MKGNIEFHLAERASIEGNIDTANYRYLQHIPTVEGCKGVVITHLVFPFMKWKIFDHIEEGLLRLFISICSTALQTVTNNTPTFNRT